MQSHAMKRIHIILYLRSFSLHYKRKLYPFWLVGCLMVEFNRLLCAQRFSPRSFGFSLFVFLPVLYSLDRIILTFFYSKLFQWVCLTESWPLGRLFSSVQRLVGLHYICCIVVSTYYCYQIQKTKWKTNKILISYFASLSFSWNEFGMQFWEEKNRPSLEFWESGM